MILSDTHGASDALVDHVKNWETIDKVIHLGDFIEDGKRVGDLTGKEVLCLRGNCDIKHYDHREEELLLCEEVSVFMTHGHRYRVKHSLLNLSLRAKEVSARIVLFGHTHQPFNEMIDNVLFFNPGSPVYPRGGALPTYGIIEIHNNAIASEIIFLLNA